MEWRNHSPWINNCANAYKCLQHPPARRGSSRDSRRSWGHKDVTPGERSCLPKDQHPQELPWQEVPSRHLISFALQEAEVLPPLRAQPSSPVPSAPCGCPGAPRAGTALVSSCPSAPSAMSITALQPRVESPKPIYFRKETMKLMIVVRTHGTIGECKSLSVRTSHPNQGVIPIHCKSL